MTGKKFDDLTGQLGLSRKDVASLTGIPLGTLQAWASEDERPVRGRDLPRALLELCAALRQRIEEVERAARS